MEVGVNKIPMVIGNKHDVNVYLTWREPINAQRIRPVRISGKKFREEMRIQFQALIKPRRRNTDLQKEIRGEVTVINPLLASVSDLSTSAAVKIFNENGIKIESNDKVVVRIRRDLLMSSPSCYVLRGVACLMYCL